MANSFSKNISIFPISFDRSAGAEFNYWQRNEKVYEGNDQKIRDYLNTNLIISQELSTIKDSDNNDVEIKDYYEKISGQASPGASYANGRILSEKNIARLIRSLTNKESFVVNANINENKCSSIEFIINGHYFAVNLNNNSTIKNDSDLWVGVNFIDSYQIEDANNTDEYETLFAYDKADNDIDYLNEVDFSNTELSSSSYDYYVLKLLESTASGTLRVPIESTFRFTENVVKKICGGTI